MVSPNYLATRFKFFNETFPVLSSSKSLKALRISYLGSLSLILVVMSSMKSANSMTPFPSLSTSAISFLTSYFFGSKPKALMATFSSFESMYPEVRQKSTNRLGIKQVECFFDLLFLFFSEFVSGLSGWLEWGFLFLEGGRHLNFYFK